MIKAEVLLSDLKKLLERLEGDLRERADEVLPLGDSLRSAYQLAKQAERTAQPFETWREEYLTQAAVAWVLACVFVRFIEDNSLIDTPLLAGAGPRLDQAKDQRTLYFQQHPTDSDREYLHYVFRNVEAVPAAAPLFDERHNPLWTYGVSGDGATSLIEFWQRIDPATGMLAHDFADPALNTRFLGDLYQDLSEAARKKYALLQTPEFVEEFILDLTLTPAIAEFGFVQVRLIDPACGSGHFLLGAFHRLLHEWQTREPAVNVRELAQRSLDAVHGVDLNPYAVAIARFRLIIAALKALDVRRLADAPAFHTNLATGDSLLHGPRPGGERQTYLAAEADPLRHVYDTEDAEDLRRILGACYHAVVGNPPYITVKDKALNEAYRERLGSCYRQYSLAVPFMERFFDLAIASEGVDIEPAGYVGMITANSFMKREFGKRLIEEYIPRWDLTHVVDTSGACIPGHNTPTVILFARRRRPISDTVRAVLGIRGEPRTPEDPSQGLVWSSIIDQVDKPSSVSAFVSVADMPRVSFHSHPWSIGGGGAAELKALLDDAAKCRISDVCAEIGFVAVTREDDVFWIGTSVAHRYRIAATHILPLVAGEAIRDWAIHDPEGAIWPYDRHSLLATESEPAVKFLWPWRTQLSSRVAYGQSQIERGLHWYEYSMFFRDRFRVPRSIAFAFVATHNHFTLDRGGKIFKQSAPVIKLPDDASEEDHLALLGLLNSSTACFWGRQTFFPKGGYAAGKWEERLEWDGTKLASFPVPRSKPEILHWAQALDRSAASLQRLVSETFQSGSIPTSRTLEVAHQQYLTTLSEMIGQQEELDWSVYALYGLPTAVSDQLEIPPLRLGQRAFEIVMARLVSTGELETSWFERHRSTPTTDLSAGWPGSYSEMVDERISLIKNNPAIALIEQPEHKRRWNIDSWEQHQERELRRLLLARLEVSRAMGRR